MIKSMTGFGRGEAAESSVRYEVEVRGLNHRFLEIRTRLPQEIGHWEAEIRAHVARVARRGRIDLMVSRAQLEQPEATVTINREVVARYLEAGRAIASEFRLPGNLSLESVLALPAAVRIELQRERESGGEKEALFSALDQALAGYDEARIGEGIRLAHDLEARIASTEGLLEEIERAAAERAPEHLRKLRERMAALMEGLPVDEVRLAQEAAHLVDRSDVTEEIVRLRGHLQQALAILASGDGAVGRSLDFLVQEMHREANTIGSKTETLDMARAVLRVKTEVEKVREQVQNVE